MLARVRPLEQGGAESAERWTTRRDWRRQRATTQPIHQLPSVVRSRVIPPGGGRAGLERVTMLTPYEAETIAADARRAGPGARLEVIVPPSTSAARLAAVESLFAWLREKGIEVSVRRDEEES